MLRKAARSMRGQPIDVEKTLWWRLRGRKPGGLKFRRQHPVGRFIADFVCLEAALIVEPVASCTSMRTSSGQLSMSEAGRKPPVRFGQPQAGKWTLA